MTFDGIALANRTDTTNQPAYYRMRLASVKTETGSIVAPTYTLTNPCATPVTVAPATNTTSCYPVSWTPTGYTDQIVDWFNKWAVTKVVETDRPQAAPARVTNYVYSGGTAWRYDDNETVKAKYRTYSQFRGYGNVQTIVGDGVNDKQTQTRVTYFRGMSQNNGGPTVTLTDSVGGGHEDLDVLAGRTLESTSYLGNGGPVDSSTISDY